MHVLPNLPEISKIELGALLHEKEKRLLQSDLLEFTKHFFEVNGNRFVVSEHHRMICDTLKRVENGEIKNLLINIPPRYAKTCLLYTSPSPRDGLLSRMPSSA